MKKITDTDRIAWIGKQKNRSRGIVWYSSLSNKFICMDRTDAGEFMFKGKTPRQAIDRAMKASRRGKK